MISKPEITADSVKKMINGRAVYIWGARHDGLGIHCALKRIGLKVDGFLDNNRMLEGKSILGAPIQHPEKFFTEPTLAKEPFVFVASAYFADEIVEECQGYGLQKGESFITTQDLQCFNWQIDTSGACNLRCISCARGNFPDHHPAGFMSANVYGKVIKKILEEDPFTGVFRIYDWGEPLLTPELPEIIEITNDHDVLSVISSNLCINNNLERVIRACPTWFRVSLSGWGDNYEITHTGGKWEVLYKNMHQLSELRSKYSPDMEVEVFFHIYKHNRSDFDKIRQLCEDLGFTPRYTHAYLFSLDSVEAVLDGKPLNAAITTTCNLMLLKVDEAMNLARKQQERFCFFERFLRITWDLKVTSCINWYNPKYFLIEDDFLSSSVDNLVEARNSCPLCIHCKSKSLHRYCNVYGDPKLVLSKGSITI